MTKRGSKYARKHFVKIKEKESNEKKQKDIENEILQNPYMEVIYDDVTFVETFHRLDEENAFRAYEKLIEQSKEKNPDKKMREDALHKLAEINKSMGLHVVEREGVYLPKEEKMIVRMDIYGRIDRIDPRLREEKLSPYYRDLMKKPMKKRVEIGLYDFDNAPSWKLYARFSSFRSIQKRLKSYLHEHKINPQILALMTPRDFSDLIVQTFQTSALERRVSFVSNGSVKEQFVKDVATMYGSKMAEIWRKKGYDERYIASKLNAMRRFGATNSNKLIITEIYFTPRVLEDLKAKGLLSEKFKKGKKIPQYFIDYLIDTGRGDLIVARDENGKKILGGLYPSEEVHHKYAVSEGGYLTNIACANYRNNLCLVPSDIHSRILHVNDQISDGKRDTYSRRTEFIDDDVFFMGGLDKKDQLKHNFSKNKNRRMKHDDKHNVTYEDCMRELAGNQRAYDEEHKKYSASVREVSGTDKAYQTKRILAKKIKIERRMRKHANMVPCAQQKMMREKLNLFMKDKFNEGID